MTRSAAAPLTPARRLLRDRRAIGPIGTISRIAGGLIAIALPIAIGGFAWWDAAAALVALPLVATGAAVIIVATYRRLAPQALRRARGSAQAPRAG